ncbi:MAG: UDP-N-acetylglucosamine 2-epimerase [Acidimicrobiales bacterium]
MIVFVYGTTGELIKLAPVMRRLQDQDEPYICVSTNQQARQIHPMCDELELRHPDHVLWGGIRGHDLSKSWQIPLWAIVLAVRFVWLIPRLRRERGPGQHVVMVHGDTITTVAGAVMGRCLRSPVAHLEAGLRSHDWRHPFPEELNRRIVSRLAVLHYAPNDVAVKNLVGTPGETVNIEANTVRDSLELVPRDRLPSIPGIERFLDEPFGLVSIHRFELLAQRDRLQELLELLTKETQRTRLLFIDHPVTVAKLEQYRLQHLFDDDRFVRVPRLSYLNFISMLRQSRYLVTDSGGAQEECYFMDQPCLVHRMASERHEGVGTNVVLSKFDLGVLKTFLDDPERYRVGHRPEVESPSDKVIADLRERGFLR